MNLNWFTILLTEKNNSNDRFRGYGTSFFGFEVNSDLFEDTNYNANDFLMNKEDLERLILSQDNPVKWSEWRSMDSFFVWVQ